MPARPSLIVLAVLFTCATLVAAGTTPRQAQKTPVPIPNPGVPQIQTLEAQFVRIAYNNEGYVSLGYRLANTLVGKEWILLEVGMTVREGQQAFKLTRDAISLSLPDESTVPLPSQAEYSQVDLRAIENQSKVLNDSIN